MHGELKDPEQRALRLLKRGRSKAALAIATVGLCRDLDAAGLWLLRASIHHAEQKWDSALADVEHAMTLVPLPHRGQLILADCYRHTGRRDLALTAYEHLLTAPDQPQPFYAQVYRGLVLCDRRDLALRCCRVAVKANPDDHAALFAMAHCMVALRYDATYVAAVLRQAVDVAPDRDAYRVSLALQLTRCGRSAEAYTQLLAASIDQLLEVTCDCSARRLLSVCQQAGDHERVAALESRLNNSNSDRNLPGDR